MDSIKVIKKWCEKNREMLLSNQVERIVGSFAGSGDEGCWEGFETFPNQEYARKIPDNIKDSFESLDPGGYEDGEGGGGSITLDVKANKLSLNTYWNEVVQRDNPEEEIEDEEEDE